MKGYLERDDWTAQKISDNWFSTGDIGFIDESGQLVLKGRERDEINRGGLKIYPVDIEAVVSRFPGVIEACCFACDDPVFDQSVGVSIVTNEEITPFLADLYEWTSEHLPSYKIPTCWFRVDGIPKSNRGKINRKELALHCAGLKPLNMTRFLKAVN
jgi:acyl-CoA synthetase (AMP-forming)/AMP-acid ligase II